MPKNSIYAQTQDKTNFKVDKKITAKQWKIYYYMLSVSKFNAQRVENHRYLYKKDFSVVQTCKTLGIKSSQTFYNAIKRLELHGLVESFDSYYLLYAKNWIDIDKDTLKALVEFSNMKDQDIDLLRIFLILKKLDKIADSSDERSFTLRQLNILLGHNDTTAEYYRSCRIYLALLCFWGLIELKVHKDYSKNFGAYTVYHLQNVSDKNLNQEFELNLEAEMNAALPSKELMDKLVFSFPEILNEE